MRWLLLVLPLFVVAVPQDGYAKGKRGRAAKTEKLPPLPEPTALSLEFTAESDDEKLFEEAATTAVSAAATGSTEHSITWTVGDWRRQMKLDVERMSTLQKAMAQRLANAYKENFTVAIRYLRGVYQTVEQLQHLGHVTYDEFNEEMPADRDPEKSPAPPPSARRVRLYLSKIENLDTSATSFLERTVAGTAEEIVRIDASE